MGDSVIKNGEIALPERPGLGIDIDIDEINNRLAAGEDSLEPEVY